MFYFEPICNTIRLSQIFIILFLSSAAAALGQVPIASPSPTPELVFSTKTTGENGEQKTYVYLKTQGLKTFKEEANKLGQLGYRLEFMAPFGHAIAILSAPDPASGYNSAHLGSIFKLDKGNTYEYDWFEAETPGQIVTRMNDRAEKGFYFRNGVPASDSRECGGSSSSSGDGTSQALENLLAMTCASHSAVYFVEKKNGVMDKREYRVHYGQMGWGKNPSEEISLQLNETAQRGFRPVAIGWVSEGFKGGTYAVIEQAGGETAKPTGMTYKFLRSEFGFTKKVNELAKEGYRLKFDMTAIAQELGLMEKAPDGTPTSYRWIDATGKTSEQDMAAAFNAGVRFAMTNRDAEDLIFEDMPPQGDKFDYKMLDMYPFTIKPTKKNPNPPATKTQEQIFSEFDAAIAGGYTIRDIYISKGIKVLFERKK
jgi:hypothetical protein